jgi:hypothetical protein
VVKIGGTDHLLSEIIQCLISKLGKIMGTIAQRGSEATIGKMLPRHKSIAEAS